MRPFEAPASCPTYPPCGTCPTCRAPRPKVIDTLDISPGRRALLTAIKDNAGFLSAQEVVALVEDDSTRLTLLLVRFHEGRVQVPAQDCARLILSLRKDGWCLRDVSVAQDLH